ncbi:hypothetical protein HHI36_009239 [Cryptolaemus montrouzieri]|uniref:Uncharacterized protein n=1 Tax=Cryptolaemus montrouzieri TaxID=559131 RepID=A0ABD2MV48_9CUCU
MFTVCEAAVLFLDFGCHDCVHCGTCNARSQPKCEFRDVYDGLPGNFPTYRGVHTAEQTAGCLRRVRAIPEAEQRKTDRYWNYHRCSADNSFWQSHGTQSAKRKIEIVVDRQWQPQFLRIHDLFRHHYSTVHLRLLRCGKQDSSIFEISSQECGMFPAENIPPS